MKKFVFFLLALLTLTFPFSFTSCEKPPKDTTDVNGGTTGQIDPNTVLTLNPTQVSITPGEQKRISIALNPQPSVAFNIAWTSSNPAVATVAGAVITGVATGEATITATIEGTQISASVAVKVGTAIENADFSNVKVIGYQTDMIPLSIQTYELGENGDTIWKTVTDINEDGTDDTFLKAIAYLMPSTMTFESGTGVVGNPGYVVSVHTAIIFDGTYIYPFWTYTFSDDEEKYLTKELNEAGKPVVKWRYATYTHFNEYTTKNISTKLSLLKVLGLQLKKNNKLIWPKTLIWATMTLTWVTCKFLKTLLLISLLLVWLAVVKVLKLMLAKTTKLSSLTWISS
jgi:hypothetical protein